MFTLFKSILLRNRSLSIKKVKWFCAQKREIGKGNLKLTKIRPGINEFCCTEDDHNYLSNMCAKKKILSFELAKHWFFKILPQIQKIHQNFNFLQQLPVSWKLHASSMTVDLILSFNFVSCEPLSGQGLVHARWWSRGGVPMDSNPEQYFLWNERCKLLSCMNMHVV